jgi:hypothetical protein
VAYIVAASGQEDHSGQWIDSLTKFSIDYIIASHMVGVFSTIL